MRPRIGKPRIGWFGPRWGAESDTFGVIEGETGFCFFADLSCITIFLDFAPAFCLPARYMIFGKGIEIRTKMRKPNVWICDCWTCLTANIFYCSFCSSSLLFRNALWARWVCLASEAFCKSSLQSQEKGDKNASGNKTSAHSQTKKTLRYFEVLRYVPVWESLGGR